MYRYDKKVINQANKDLTKLLVKIVRTKKGGNRNTPANVDSGKMIKSLDTFFDVDKDGSIQINIEAIEYYQYLDKGTKHIKPYFYTDELFESAEFNSIIETLMVNLTNNLISDKISKIK